MLTLVVNSIGIKMDIFREYVRYYIKYECFAVLPAEAPHLFIY